MTNLLETTDKELASMDISPQKFQELLEEIERLKRENALLRQAAGIQVSKPDPEPVQVTASERQALLRKTV
ncbi:MAG: hypothetical protein GX971_07710 [Firmicutes bacterium]|nr:hypothetical protein [Bacillota bacterium]